LEIDCTATAGAGFVDGCLWHVLADVLGLLRRRKQSMHRRHGEAKANAIALNKSGMSPGVLRSRSGYMDYTLDN